jgi:NAD-dependent deacetylase
LDLDLDTITHVFFTGAGISAESGLPTFRGEGGYWRNYPAEQLADIRFWRQNYALVHEFYDMRRATLAKVSPNAAHEAIAALGRRALVLTQNVDDLFERAGCEQLVHLHGRLWQMHCTACGHRWDFGLGPWEAHHACPRCAKRESVKPGVVMFNESAPEYAKLGILRQLGPQHTFAVIGTSGAVLDVNALARMCTAGRKVLNNAEASAYIDEALFDEVYYAPATEVITRIVSPAAGR